MTSESEADVILYGEKTVTHPVLENDTLMLEIFLVKFWVDLGKKLRVIWKVRSMASMR